MTTKQRKNTPPGDQIEITTRVGLITRRIQVWLGSALSHTRRLHASTLGIAHTQLMGRSRIYNWWHSWSFKKIHHRHVHWGMLGAYAVAVMLFSLISLGVVKAADLTDLWNFSNSSLFTFDDGVETSGSAARLKAQNYANDSNTSALYHFDESNGTAVGDSSSNSNNATTTGSPTFGTGNLNNALSLNGTSQYASAPDSASLSLTGQASLEAWIKPSSTFNNNSSFSQTILDKGSYKLGLDRTTGKAFYEVERNGFQSWTKRLGNEQAGSWSFNHAGIWSMVAYGTDMYVGTGSGGGDGEVWKWDGSTWTKVGGDGTRSGWAAETYESVRSLAVNNTTLYAGLGDSTGDGEIWSCDLAASCATWTKIGGDGLGSGGPAAFTYSSVDSMAVHGGSLYVGMAGAAGAGDLFRYNGGTSWTQVAGDGLNSSWAASTFSSVSALYSDGSNLYVGLNGGSTAGTGDLWKYNGSTWSQIGGDGINPGGGASWNTNYERVASITSISGVLYVGLGDSASDAEVWRLNGTTWSQVGGDGLNSGWSAATYTRVYSLVSDGTNLYAGTGSGSGSGDVWKWNGSTWARTGGGGTNGTTAWSTSIVAAMAWNNSKLYAAPASTTTFGSALYEYNGSAWNMIGGHYLNNSWGTYNISRIASSTVYNGKLYYGLGIGTNNAQVFEYDGTTARRIGGSGLDGSWPVWTYESVSAMVAYKGELYVGLGTGNGDAEVWKWNGSTWSKVAGDGLSSTWNSSEPQVTSMAVFNDKLYVGLGVNAYQADIWQFNGTTWSLVAGEPGSAVGGQVNGSWNVNPRAVETMTVYNGQLCAGLGGSGAWGEVWCWSGSGNWTKIGGGNGVSVNGSWSSSIQVNALAVYNGKLYATISTSGHAASVWEWNGVAWTQIAGADLNSGWSDNTYTTLPTMTVYNGYLYIGTAFSGASNPTGDVWRWNGTSLSQVGGDGINSSWATGDQREEVRNLITYKGKLYAGLGFSADIDPLIYSFGDNAYVESTTSSFSSSWHHLAGTYDGANIKLYVDGNLEGNVGASGGGIDNDRGLRIGSGFGSVMTGAGSELFNGQIDEVRISNTARSSFTTMPYKNSRQLITLAAAERTSGVASWAGFAASETTNGGTIAYRLSDDDAATWKYWNGSSWVSSADASQTNDAATINAHIGTFPVTFKGIRWQAALAGDGTQQVQLNSVTITSNSDSAAPSVNAGNILAFSSNGGTSIASNAWTNTATPYFSWDAATDNGAGILGYCVYVGQDQTADPVATKGMLGTTPVATGNNCQYITANPSLNLATSGVLDSQFITSNSPYYINVKAIDRAGQVYPTSTQFQFRFDNTPPTNPAFITAPSEFVSSKEVTFTWPTVGGDASSDANSGVSGLQYRIGPSGAWRGDGVAGAGLLDNDGSYTTRDNPDFADITDGNNVFYFRTQDQAGNISSGFASATLRLNTGSPSTPQNLTATPPTNTSNSFAFSWSAPASFAGNASNLTYCYTVNTLPTANTCTYTSAGVTSLPAAAYATQPGENTLYVVAKDNNVNYATAASVTFTANTSAPGIPLDPEIADISTKSTSSWKLALSWTAPTDAGAGIGSYRVYRSTDNATFSQIATTAGTSYVDSGLQQLTYYYQVKACDSANNCGAASSVVDKLPTGRFTTAANITAQPSVSGVSTRKATIRWATDRISDSKISIGTAAGQYDPFQIASQAQVTDHTVQLSNLTPGTTYFAKATWTDEDGNTGVSSEFSFKTEPAPSTQEVVTQRVGLSSALLRFTSVSAAKVVVQYGKTDSFGGAKEVQTSLSRSTYDLELTGLDDDAKYFYRLNTYDAEGNEYVGSTVLSFTTPARPRISDLRFEPVKGEPTSTQRVTWTTNVNASSTVTYGKQGTNGVDIADSTMTRTHEIIIRGLDDNSVYFLLAQSRDIDGNLAVSDRQSFQTALDTRPPTIKDVAVETVVKGTGSEARGQIVVTWTTDEPSTSQVAFGEGAGSTSFSSLTTEDAGLTTEHVVIISDVSTARVYNIQAISRDKARNEAKSDTQSAIIGRGTDSILSIIVNVFQQIFGGASK